MEGKVKLTTKQQQLLEKATVIHERLGYLDSLNIPLPTLNEPLE